MPAMFKLGKADTPGTDVLSSYPYRPEAGIEGLGYSRRTDNVQDQPAAGAGLLCPEFGDRWDKQLRRCDTILNIDQSSNTRAAV
jgi:hypothetical protein